MGVGDYVRVIKKSVVGINGLAGRFAARLVQRLSLDCGLAVGCRDPAC